MDEKREEHEQEILRKIRDAANELASMVYRDPSQAEGLHDILRAGHEETANAPPTPSAEAQGWRQEVQQRQAEQDRREWEAIPFAELSPSSPPSDPVQSFGATPPVELGQQGSLPPLPSSMAASVRDTAQQATRPEQSSSPDDLLAKAFPELDANQRMAAWSSIQNQQRDQAGQGAAGTTTVPTGQESGVAEQDNALRQLHEAARTQQQTSYAAEVEHTLSGLYPLAQGAGGSPPTPPGTTAAAVPAPEDDRRRREIEGTTSYQHLQQSPQWTGEDVAAWDDIQKARGRQAGTPDLSQLADMERNAPPAPADMGRETAEDSGPPQRNFVQRARKLAEEAGFMQPEHVPEEFQTDEWKQQQAPLSQQERWQLGADVAAVATLGYVGMRGARGATQFVSDEGTGQVLGDMQEAAIGGAGRIAGAATAGSHLGGPAGMMAGLAIGAASEVATLPQKILDWSEALVKSREHLAMWSGQLQQIGREAEIRGYMRDIQSAQETAPMADVLNKTLQDVLDELRPMKDDVFKIASLLATSGLRALQAFLAIQEHAGAIASPLLFAIDKVGRFIDWWMGKEERDPTTVQQWADAWRNHVPTNRVRR